MKLKKSKKGTDVLKKDIINEDLFKVEELEPRLELGYVDAGCGSNGVCGNDTDVDGVCDNDTDVDTVCGGDTNSSCGNDGNGDSFWNPSCGGGTGGYPYY